MRRKILLIYLALLALIIAAGRLQAQPVEDNCAQLITNLKISGPGSISETVDLCTGKTYHPSDDTVLENITVETDNTNYLQSKPDCNSLVMSAIVTTTQNEQSVNKERSIAGFSMPQLLHFQHVLEEFVGSYVV